MDMDFNVNPFSIFSEAEKLAEVCDMILYHI